MIPTDRPEPEVRVNSSGATRVNDVSLDQSGRIDARPGYSAYQPPAPDLRRPRRDVLVVAPQPFYEDRGTPIAVLDIPAFRHFTEFPHCPSFDS